MAISTVVVLPKQSSSWTYVLDQKRISTQVAADQLRQVLSLLPCRPIVMTDRRHRCQGFLRDTEALACDKLLHVKRNRAFYHPVHEATGKQGTPRKDGECFQCNDLGMYGPCNEQCHGTYEYGHQVEVMRWNSLHLRSVRHLELALIRVLRHGAIQRPLGPKENWFLWTGQEALPLSEVGAGYRRRYLMEHGYRFEKQVLLWTKPHGRALRQFERWTDVVVIAHNLLFLARPVVEADYRGWESKHRQTTPRQVRRGMRRILAQFGMSTQTPQQRGKLPGRASGTVLSPPLCDGAKAEKVVEKATSVVKQSVNRSLHWHFFMLNLLS